MKSFFRSKWRPRAVDSSPRPASAGDAFAMKPLHTHYDNLKVARNAPPEVIRAAYKTLCHKFHPDRHGGHPASTQTFQLITAAYDVLSDPERRRRHDAWIAKMEAGQANAEASPWDGRERRLGRWPLGRRRSRQQHPPSTHGRTTAHWPPQTVALWLSAMLTALMLAVVATF